jgi:hypothetical protein
MHGVQPEKMRCRVVRLDASGHRTAMSLIALPHGQVATPFCCWRAVSQCLAVGLHQGHVDKQDVFKAGPGSGNNRPVQSAPLTEMSAPDEGQIALLV